MTAPRHLSLVLAIAFLAALLGLAWSAPASAPSWKAVVIGPARGELEPCGCSGGQMGGIDRVARAVAVAASPGAGEAPTAAVKVAAGGVVSADALAHPEWALAQLETLWMAYAHMGVAAIGVASTELALGPELLGAYRGLVAPGDVVASNVVDAEGAFALAPVHVDPATGVRVLSFALAPEQPIAPWRVLAPAEAIERLRASGAGPLGGPGTLVLVEGELERAQEIARLLDAPAVLLHFGAAHDPDLDATPLEGGHVAGAVGQRGRHLVTLAPRDRDLVALAPRDQGGTDWRVVPVSQDVPVDPAFAAYREQYRLTLGAGDVVGALAGRRGPHPDGLYAGSDACADCHVEAYEIWKETLHYRGALSLEEDLRGSADALADPKCVACHVVGFEYESGWRSAGADERIRDALANGLGGVGCESCHGPGAEHVRSEDPADVVRSGEARCIECHDGENDPAFDFSKKWPLVRH